MAGDEMSWESLVEQLESLSDVFAVAGRELKEFYEPKAVPSTIYLGELGSAFADGVARNVLDAGSQQVALSLVEGFLREGDETTQTAVATGFLEALISGAEGSGMDFAKLAPMLGPSSREYLREWDRLCGCRTPGLWP